MILKSFFYKYILAVVIAMLISIGVSHNAMGQCGIALKDEAVKYIDGATYLKDFRVRFEKGKYPGKTPSQEFSILLNKGTKYRFNIKADSACNDQPILKLYDFQHFYGSNYDDSDGSTYEKFEFFCAKTQVYYISISFANSLEGCAAAIVSYVGNYDAN